MKHTAKRSLAIGILGLALLLGLAAGVAARQSGSPGASVSDGAAVSVPGDAANGGAPYRLSPPNERETDGSAGAPPAIGGRAVYHVSPPNETDPGSTGADSRIPERSAPYRVSPPNERDPGGP